MGGTEHNYTSSGGGLTFSDFQQRLQQFAIKGVRYGVLKHTQKRLSVRFVSVSKVVNTKPRHTCDVSKPGDFARCSFNLLNIHTHTGMYVRHYTLHVEA